MDACVWVGMCVFVCVGVGRGRTSTTSRMAAIFDRSSEPMAAAYAGDSSWRRMANMKLSSSLCALGCHGEGGEGV